MSDACEMCDDTGYEPGSVPLSFCTLCSRGLSVAVQAPPSDPVVITEAWYVCTVHGPVPHDECWSFDQPCPRCATQPEGDPE